MPRTNIHRDALAAIGNLNDVKEALELNHMPTWLIDDVTTQPSRCAANQAFGFQMGLHLGLDEVYADNFHRVGLAPEYLLSDNNNDLHWFKRGEQIAAYVLERARHELTDPAAIRAQIRGAELLRQFAAMVQPPQDRTPPAPHFSWERDKEFCQRCDSETRNGYCNHCEHECGNDCEDRRCREVGCSVVGCDGECRDDEERRWCEVCQDYAPRFCDCPRPAQTRPAFIRFYGVPSMRPGY